MTILALAIWLAILATLMYLTKTKMPDAAKPIKTYIIWALAIIALIVIVYALGGERILRTRVPSLGLVALAAQNPQAPVTTRVPQPVLQPALQPAGPPTSVAPLLTASDLVYVGAFRLPAGLNSTTATFAYGGQSLGYNPNRNTLIIGGHVNYQMAAEVSIPTPTRAAKVSDLPRAALVQSWADPFAGKRGIYRLGGFLPLADRLIVSAFVYYDNNHVKPSHFRTGLDFKSPSVLQQIGNIDGGFTGGYMAQVPPEWQAALGGSYLTGQCCVPVIGRSSAGPSVTVFDPMAVGTGPVPATMLVGYPILHQTLGGCKGTKGFDCTAHMGGVIFPSGTRSLVFFGRLADAPVCYGEGTKDTALVGQLVGTSTVDRYCLDYVYASKGNHAAKYKQVMWFYDANDLAVVKAGTNKPWDVKPIAFSEFHTPFETVHKLPVGVAWDPVRRWAFVTMDHQDGSVPLVHVWSIK